MKKSELGKLLVDYTESLEGESGMSEFDEMDETAPLFETVRILSSAMKPKQPSEELSARILQAVQAKAAQEEFQDKVAEEKKNSAEKIQNRGNIYSEPVSQRNNVPDDIYPGNVL